MAMNSDRLMLLAEHIKMSLLERKRALSLNLEPNSADDAAIQRSLNTLLQGIEEIEAEQTRMEEHGEASSKVLREREDVLVRLRSQYDDLSTQYHNPGDSTGTIDLSNTPSRSVLDAPRRAPLKTFTSYDEEAAREALMGSREIPANLRNSKSKKTVRFSDATEVDTDDLDNGQVLQLHQRIMEEQDESLDRLGESISRQRELSMQIGDELESQVELLDDIDGHVDRTAHRLDGAKKRLNNISKKAKDNGSLVTIAILIIVLILLIALLK